MIAIADYGMGNLRSVEKAFHHLGHEAFITPDPEKVGGHGHLVLPGDAAFGDAMRNLRAAGWDRAIADHIDAGRPFLGICVGLQLMFATSQEMGQHAGLGLFAGRCLRFPDAERVPQIGWNEIEIRRPCALLEGIEDGSFFYFVHSFYVEADAESDVVATTHYGLDYTSIAARHNLYGVQFHPEKSQKVGLRLLDNFARLR